MKTANFNLYSKYYDLLYQDKDYQKEASYIINIMRENNITMGEVLEYGSGTGKHGCLIAESGYKVHGIELSEAMVSIAKRVPGFTIQQGDIAEVKLDREFDVLISIFHVISYQTLNSSLTEVFTRVNEHLRTGGIFIFDFWYSPAVYVQKPTVRIKRICGNDLNVTRIAEPKVDSIKNTVDVEYTIFAEKTNTGEVEVLKELHRMRHFSIPEITLLAQQHGLMYLKAEESFTGKPVGDDTWSVSVVLKKI